MSRDVTEIVICREQHKFVADTELREERIDCADLDALLPACVAQSSRRDVIFTVGNDQRERCEAVDYLLLGFRSREALE